MSYGVSWKKWFFCCTCFLFGSQHNVDGIKTRLRAGRSTIFGSNLDSWKRPDRLWGPPSPLFIVNQDLFHWRQSGRCVRLTTHLDLVTRLRMSGGIPLLPLWHHVLQTDFTFLPYCLFFLQFFGRLIYHCKAVTQMYILRDYNKYFSSVGGVNHLRI